MIYIGYRMRAIVALLLFTACTTPKAIVPPPPDIESHIAPVEKMIDHCQHQGVYVLCELEPWIEAIVG